MSKKETKVEEKIQDGKKAAKKAEKKSLANKIDKEAKKLSEKAALEIAANMGANQGNAFLLLHAEHGKAEEAIAVAQAWKRGVRKKMIGIKVDMDAYNRVNKLFKMDASDVAAKKTTEALYEQQLSMQLSPEQKKLVDEVSVKRENARAAMSDLAGGESGKEIGSGQSAGADAEPVPTRNENLGKSFRPAANAH